MNERLDTQVEDGWKDYRRSAQGKSHYPPGPHVAIQSGQNLYFNHDAAQFLGDRVVLRYNSLSRQIGVRPASEDEYHGLMLRPITLQGKVTGSGRRMGATGFFRAFNIPWKEVRGVYPAVWHEDLRLLTVQLPEFTPTGKDGA